MFEIAKLFWEYFGKYFGNISGVSPGISGRTPKMFELAPAQRDIRDLQGRLIAVRPIKFRKLTPEHSNVLGRVNGGFWGNPTQLQDIRDSRC